MIHETESKLITLANIVPTILLGIKRGIVVHSFQIKISGLVIFLVSHLIIDRASLSTLFSQVLEILEIFFWCFIDVFLSMGYEKHMKN